MKIRFRDILLFPKINFVSVNCLKTAREIVKIGPQFSLVNKHNLSESRSIHFLTIIYF